MTQNPTTQSFTQIIKAPISQVFLALTNASLLREWFCDIATTKPSPGGRFYVGWNNNYYVSGDYIAIENNSLIDLNWLGKDDPGKTRVKITLSQSNNETSVVLDHTGIGTTKQWEKTAQEINKGWQTGLENLKSTHENGEDLRIVRRPMLGIIIDKVDEMGISLNDVVEGMGAYEIGLRKGDIINKIDGIEIKEYGLLTELLNHHYAGDEIKINFMHDSKLKTSKLKLSARNIPPILWNPCDFAKEIKLKFKEDEEKLIELTKGISEVEANHKPNKDQWSVKEIIAHLIHGQRFILQWLSEMIGMQEAVADDFGGNQNAAVVATSHVYPTLKEIIEAYKRCNAELVTYIAELPPEFVARKSSYWRLAFNLLESPYHFYGHVDQINAVLEDARRT